MQDLQAMIKNSAPNADVDDIENEDEFEGYMENALMQEADSLGIFDSSKQAAEANVYQEALKRVEQEVAKVPSQSNAGEEKKGEDEGQDLDQFGDDLMSKMMQEGSQNESNYVTEYNEVVAEISQICNMIMANQKAPNQARPLNELDVVELCPRITTLATEYRRLP